MSSLKRTLAPVFLVSPAIRVLLSMMAASANQAHKMGIPRGAPAINRAIQPDPQVPALHGPAQAEILEDEARRAPSAILGAARLGYSTAQTVACAFYGNETLNPLLDSGTMIIPLPGGERVEIRDGETTYVLTDHLESTRAALRADNTVPGGIEYTPFGEMQHSGDADVVRSYTGKVF